MRMFDIRFRGPFHTWTNKRPSEPITKKLDRLLVNNSWLSDFPNSVDTFPAPDISNHAHCSFDLAIPLPYVGTKPFRFFNFLSKHSSVCLTVEPAWSQTDSLNSHLSSFCHKLKNLKESLNKTLNKENFSNI